MYLNWLKKLRLNIITRRVLLLLLSSSVLNSCDDTATSSKAILIQNYAKKLGIYQPSQIYLSTLKSSTLSLPDLHLFDSTGKSLQVGNCMNALDDLILYLNCDTFKYVYTAGPNFQKYVINSQIVSVDDLSTPKIQSPNSFYVCYHWDYRLEFIYNAQSASEIFTIMKKAQQLASSSRIKLMFIHSNI